ncbi:hypothetical protein EGW08_013831 [Elysia chlorotica]|uniref:Uncharacterized protein n=1 Tax=Elysia chlorotica TaxID=188477 RepID=A0A433TA03_ELYCH|nr:hypothetical protein EGW08_013831 [Elysia chlorotica]
MGMWRLLNNLTRVFRTHVYNPRPSAGILDDKEHEHAGQSYCIVTEHGKNKNLNRDEEWDSGDDTSRQRGHKSNINGGDGSDRQKTYNQDFWHLLHGNHGVFQLSTWSPVSIWGSDRENFKGRFSSNLLYHILFALPGRFSPPTLVRPILPGVKEERLDQGQSHPPQLAIKDEAGAAIDKKINTSKSESLEVAMKEFKQVCYEYSACSESLLGLQAANSGNMTTAVEHLRRSCILGNMSACFNLGLCYETGSGVPQDETKAVYFYQKAAEGGHKMAMYNLGLLCLKHGEEGLKEEEDVNGKTNRKRVNLGLSKEMGLDFIEEAADLGLPEAQTYLGLYLMEECHEPTQAVVYFKAAANQNDSEAQYLLAMCYEQGLGVETNECLAARFYSLAAQTGHNLALYNLGVFYEEGLGGLPQNEATAVEMYRKAAKLGSAEAEVRLAEILGTEYSDPSNTELMSSHDDCDNQEAAKCEPLGYGLPSEQGETETDETSLAFGSTAVKDQFVSLLSPSSSFPSLRSLSSVSLPKKRVEPSYLSSSQHSDMKYMRKDGEGSLSSELPKANNFLGQVNLFLEMAPTSLTLDHDLNVTPDSMPSFSLGEEEMGAGIVVPSMHKSHTFSDFSMIGI